MTSNTVLTVLLLCSWVPLYSLGADTQRFREKDILNFHNYYRCLHGTRPLVWDNGLAASAQEWAYNRQNIGCNMAHSGYAQLGENVAAGTWRGLTAYNWFVSEDDVVNAWYHEDFTYGSSAITINHFTQIVWHGSTRVGCAWAACNNAQYEFWVCQYTPAGNWMTAAQINANVPRPCRTRGQCEFIMQNVNLTNKFGTADKITKAMTANQINPATYNYAAQTCLTPVSSYTQQTTPICVADSTVLPKTLDVTVQNPTSTGALTVKINCPSNKPLSGTGLVTCQSGNQWNIAGSCGGTPVTAAPSPLSPATTTRAPTTTTRAPTPAPTPAPPAPSTDPCWGSQIPNTFLSGFAPGWTPVKGLQAFQAKSACRSLLNCGGITQTSTGWQPRAGTDPKPSSSGEVSILRLATCVLTTPSTAPATLAPPPPPASGKCYGPLLANQYLYLYPRGYTPPATSSLADALAACNRYTDCGGVTNTGTRWEARQGNVPMPSSRGESSYRVVSCGPASAETQSAVQGQWKWLIPLIAVVGVLIVATAGVLFCKKRRARGYSGDLGFPVPKDVDPKVEEATLTAGIPDPETSVNPSTLSPIQTTGLQNQPTYSQIPISPSRPDSPKQDLSQQKLTYSQIPTSPKSPTQEPFASPVSPSAMDESHALFPSPQNQDVTESQALVPTPPPLEKVPVSSDSALPPSEWETRTDPSSGHPYYYNTKTGVTQWEVPEGL